MLTRNIGSRIDKSANGIQAVTLAATSTLVNVKPGKTFRVYNTGTAIMYIGPTAALCDVGLPIASNSKDGDFISEDGKFYMRGTAAQTATIVYFEV